MLDASEYLVELVQLESERLERYLAGISLDSWDRPSACYGWTVSDVVGHLVYWAEPYTVFILRAAEDDESPPDGWPAPGALAWQPLMDFIAETAIQRRKELGDQLLSTFRATNDRFTEVVAGLTPDVWDKPSYHPAVVGSVRARVQARIVELAVHGWDIRSQLEPSASLPQESLSVVIDTVGRRAAAYLELADFRTNRLPARYRFDLGQSNARCFDLAVEANGCRMEPPSAQAPDVTVRCDPEGFALLGLGRLKFQSAMVDGRLRVEGDQSLAAELMEWTG